MVDTRKCDLSVGLFQHFDFFDSDTISKYSPDALEHCVVPYKLGTPASVGGGALFRYQDHRSRLLASLHLNGVILGGILSDYYRYYHRNYNWASGFSLKFGFKGHFLHDKLSFAVNNQFYKFYTRNANGSNIDWSATPGGKPVNVNGDESIGTFAHWEGQLTYKLVKSLSFTAKFDLYRRSTYYVGDLKYEYGTTYNWFVDSRQQSFQLMLTYTL